MKILPKTKRFQEAVKILIADGVIKSQVDIDREAGILKSTISSAMNDSRNIPDKAISKLCTHYKLNKLFFYSGDHDLYNRNTSREKLLNSIKIESRLPDKFRFKKTITINEKDKIERIVIDIF